MVLNKPTIQEVLLHVVDSHLLQRCESLLIRSILIVENAVNNRLDILRMQIADRVLILIDLQSVVERSEADMIRQRVRALDRLGPLKRRIAEMRMRQAQDRLCKILFMESWRVALSRSSAVRGVSLPASAVRKAR